MSDIFDLLGDSSRKKAKKSQADTGDDLDFLGGFKKKVKRGEYSSTKRNDPDGVTTLDIAGLPEDQKQLMFLLLRDKTAKSEGLTHDALYEQFGDAMNLDDILHTLSEENWLSVIGSPPDERYKVNLKRKRSRLNDSLWSALED